MKILSFVLSLIFIACIMDLLGNNYLTKKLWWIKNSVGQSHQVEDKKVLINLPKDLWTCGRKSKNRYNFSYASIVKSITAYISKENKLKTKENFILNMQKSCQNFTPEQFSFTRVDNQTFYVFTCKNPKTSFLETPFRILYNDNVGISIGFIDYNSKHNKAYQSFLNSITFRDK
ncbi:MAG: Unknown protein [uncultured Campylobacterales bacterium]|uniref:Uncharacterized protein n=1 Tax=uncultured Campylobacterales bacterium TaxID=352960 RepID=A0A6S6SQN3_9BACT|nr:MAG: Unknown protein [uncultured Campylobacterales bacterium]